MQLIHMLLIAMIMILFINIVILSIPAYLWNKDKREERKKSIKKKTKFIILFFVIKIALYQLEPLILEILHRM